VTHLHVKSAAFREALLQSERLRIYIFLGSLAFILAVRTLRTLIAFSPENLAGLYLFIFMVVAVGIMELLALRSVQRTLHGQRAFGGAFWYLNIFVELSLPAISIVTLTTTAIPHDFIPLLNPTFLLYFLLLTLCTLRLNPKLSLLCGLFSSVTYLLAAWHVGWRPAINNLGASVYSPQKAVVTYALALLIAGAVVAVVARQFRKQVEAALREAETRREMEHLQHDLDVARSIQQSLLPRSMPRVSGWDIAAWNQPADQTGGDFYDWQPLPNGRVVVALADVTGHGIGPALLASVCRAYARANFRSQASFLQAMEAINSAVAADVQEGRFITFVAAILGPENPEVQILSAGHAPLFAYWLRHDRFDLMEAHGLPLGISDPFVSDPPQTLTLGSGDLLVLTTDGFFEWANANGELFGTERLSESLRAARTKSSAEIISTLYQEVLSFSGGTKQMDDLTAIVLKRL